jgi:peptide-methionine (S)-S-oxide reductase
MGQGLNQRHLKRSPIHECMKATFAAGCFWGVEQAFRKMKGVTEATSGYAGGDADNPTYKQVCSGKTGHAESVQVEYDPKRVTYEQLLELFWKIHNPTQKDRQGPDVGSQYRSVIFYHNQKQKRLAEESLKKHQKNLNKTITTKIVPVKKFWKAEEYHQRYYEKHRIFSGFSKLIKKI